VKVIIVRQLLDRELLLLLMHQALEVAFQLCPRYSVLASNALSFKFALASSAQWIVL
jgi:hypothetical protein